MKKYEILRAIEHMIEMEKLKEEQAYQSYKESHRVRYNAYEEIWDIIANPHTLYYKLKERKQYRNYKRKVKRTKKDDKGTNKKVH